MDYRQVAGLKQSGRAGAEAGDLLLFARNFFKHPTMLGSVVPSSRALINKLLRPVDWSTAKLFVEYGPGVGTITAEILKRMRPDARLVVLETNRDFVELMREKMRDPRLIVLHRSAEEVGEVLAELGLGQADYIVSGIPYSMMPEASRQAVTGATAAVLRPGGAFLVYQFSPKVRRYLESAFPEIDRDFEVLNVPPAQIFCCRKAA